MVGKKPNPDAEKSTKMINRRSVLKAAGIAGLSVTSINSVSANSLNTKVHFIEEGWEFDISYPMDFEMASSKLHIDEISYHDIDSESQRIYLRPDAPKKMKNRFRQHGDIVFGDSYQTSSTANRDWKTAKFSSGILPISLSEDTRRVAGVGLVQPLQVSRPIISPNSSSIDIRSSNKNQNLAAGMETKFKLPSIY